MLQIDSSVIQSVGYNPATRELVIKFRDSNQPKYSYPGVEQRIFNDLVTAPSSGSYFRKKICGKFPHRLVEPATK